MRTLLKAVFAESVHYCASAALLGCLLVAGDAAAQAPPGAPPGPEAQPPAGPAPGPFGPQPAPGQPAPPPGGAQPGPFGPQPPPGGAPPAGGPPPGGFGQPPGQPGGPPPAGQPGGGTSFGGEASIGPQGAEAGATASTSGELSPEERDLSLIEQSNLSGSTGLLRTAYAGSGAQGTFRVSFLMDWFSTSGFLCDPNSQTLDGRKITCSQSDAEDSASHVGAFFTLSATPLSFLEGYASIRTYANYNSEGPNTTPFTTPALLQVLGDTTLGVKVFTPPRLGKLLTFGGEIQLLLLNGTGDVGIAGGGTSAEFRGLATLDTRKANGGGFPFRVNLNLGYKLDNSGAVVDDVEAARGAALHVDRVPISRIERFGLGINRVDFFQTYLGVELPFSKFQPFAEWAIDIPINRQGYECHIQAEGPNYGFISRGDVCLGLDKLDEAQRGADAAQAQGGPGFSAIPSRLSLGVRANPFEKAFRGLTGTVAFDIGTSGTGTFVEEIAPTPPWTLYVGIGYGFDTQEKPPPPAPPAPPAPAPQMVPAPQTFVRGLVHEQNKADAPVADAIVTIEGGGPQAPVATGADGRFVTRNLDPGTYTFTIKPSAGYKPGSCQATVTAGGGTPAAGPGAPPGAPGAPGAPPGGPAAPGAPGAPPGGPFGAPPGGAPPGGPAPFGAPPGSPPGGMPPAMPTGPRYIDIDCPLEALPKVSNVVGTVKDAESGAAVAGASIKVTDSAGKEQSASADPAGQFSIQAVAPGAVTIKAEANGYMVHVEQMDAVAGQDLRPTVSLNKRPKVALVKVQGNEIKISKQIHFEIDSAKILGDSNTLLEEIADVMQKNQNIKKVEIQGHTDNTGTREHNQTLSDARANAVMKWLTDAGVSPTRLVAKGYGQDRPIAPNITEANKAKNRRVQFIITEKEGK